MVLKVCRSYTNLNALTMFGRFDAELVETIIKEMKRGKVAGLDGLSVEHFSIIAIITCQEI